MIDARLLPHNQEEITTGEAIAGRKSWDGNTSDIEVFQERAQALIETLKNSPSPRYLVADGKWYHEDNAPNLKLLECITRIPQTRKMVSQVIRQALAMDTWHRLDAQTSYQRLE